MKKVLSILILSAILVLPFAVLAQGAATPDGWAIFTGILEGVEKAFWQIFVAVVVVAFIYIGIMFLTAAGNPDKIATAKNAALWSIVGIIVGILAFVALTIITNVLNLPE